MSRCLFLVALAVFSALSGSAANESGLPLLRNFTARDYRAHHQTWGAVQDTDGVMYFGNRNGILRYDGAEWSLLPMPNTTFVRGLALAADRTIYVGAFNQLGYFPPPAKPGGHRDFVSLLEKLPAADRAFGAVWDVVVTAGGTVGFLTTNKLFLWRDGQFTSLPVTAQAQAGSDTVYLPSPTGLQVLRDGRFTTLSTDPFFEQTRIEFFLTGTDGSVLLGTTDRGLYRLVEGRLDAVPTDVDSVLRTEGLRAGRRLNDGSLALSTRNSAVLLLDRDFHLLCRLDKNTGLPNTTVRAFTADREGGLWLSHNNGTTRLEWPAAFTVFDRRNGLDANIAGDIVRHQGVLYASTGSKLFYLGHDGTAAPNAVFQPVRDAATGLPMGSSLCALLATPHGLVASGLKGVMLVTGDTARAVFDPGEPILVLADSPRDPDCVYAGLQHGVIRLRWRDGAWQFDGRVPGIDAEIRSIVEDVDGTLWASGAARGFYRITDFADFANASVEAITSGRGLPDSIANGFVYVMRWRGRPLFCGDTLYIYDAAADRFAPLAELGPKLAEFAIATQGSDSPDHLWLRTFSAAPDAGQWDDRRIWRADVGGRWQALPYLAADIVDDSRVFREEQSDGRHTLWIPGTEALLRVDLDRDVFQPTPLAAPLLHSNALTDNPTLPYAKNSLVFHFVTPAYGSQANIVYETQLIGWEEQSEAWSPANERNFINLAEGHYRFTVRARNSDGALSAVTALDFTILPPWWRTWWAYLGYALFSGTAVFGLVRWRVAALQRQNLRLEQTVATRTTELRLQEGHLRQARDAAEASSRAKSAFLANMSHELRTPLNAVLGYARMLHHDQALPTVSRQRAGVINESGSHLLRVINDVLDISKIEAGKLTLQPVDCSLPQLLSGVAETFQALAFEKGLHFQLHLASGLPDGVRADEHRLRQVLFNLLSNAVKFTAQGRVALAVAPEGERFRFTIEDTGCGIAPEQLQLIFQPFQQADGGRHQGTGLGLTISQRIVTLLGGQLEVTSTTGQGTRFSFAISLPASLHAPLRPVRPATGYLPPARKLLIVDDEAVNRDVLRGLLQPLGFAIDECTSGDECLAHVVRDRPDAILLDLRMPGLDGFATARRLRELPTGDQLVIIAVSASVFEENRQDAINVGCDEFLPKPIQLERTLAALQKLLHLEWVHPPGDSHDSFTVMPGAAVLDELRELSLSGDIESLRQRLAHLAREQPECTTFVETIDALAVRFQMKRIRDILHQQNQRRP